MTAERESDLTECALKSNSEKTRYLARAGSGQAAVFLFSTEVCDVFPFSSAACLTGARSVACRFPATRTFPGIFILYLSAGIAKVEGDFAAPLSFSRAENRAPADRPLF